MQRREEEYAEVRRVADRLKAAAGFEDLNNDTAYFIRLSKAGKELDKVTGQITDLQQEIARIIEGEFKELQGRKDRLTEKKENKRVEQSQNQNLINEYTRRKSHREGELKNKHR